MCSVGCYLSQIGSSFAFNDAQCFIGSVYFLPEILPEVVLKKIGVVKSSEHGNDWRPSRVLNRDYFKDPMNKKKVI